MSHFGKSQRNGATACARPLQKRTENASGRTMKIVKKYHKSVKNDGKTEDANKAGCRHRNSLIFLDF